MKKLLALLFSIFISFNSYGEWIEVSKGATTGNTTYIEVDRIREENGYVYFWILQDLVIPNDWGDMSIKAYWQGECGVIRMKSLSTIFYSQPMGEGTSESDNSPKEWEYLSPDSTGEAMLDYACDYVK